MKFLARHIDLIRNLAWRFSYVGAKQGTLFLVFIMASQRLSPEEFGIYSYVVAVISLLVLFADFGISSAAARYVAYYLELNREKAERLLFSSAIALLGPILIATALLILLSETYFSEFAPHLWYALPLLALIPLGSLFDGVYRGFGMFKRSAIITVAVSILSMLPMYYLVSRFGIDGAILAQVLFQGLLATSSLLALRGSTMRFDREVAWTVMKYAGVYGIAVLSYQLFARIDVLILGHYGYLNEIAAYELLNKAFAIIVLPFGLFGQVVAPQYARLMARNDRESIRRGIVKYSFASAGIAVGVGFACYLVLPVLVNAFWPQYAADGFAFIFMIALSVAVLNMSAAAIDHGIVVPAGYAHLMTRLYVIIGALNLPMAYALHAVMGYQGIMLATFISTVGMVLLLRIRVIAALKGDS